MTIPGRSALGKGLSALIPAPKMANHNDNFFMCPVGDVCRDPNQPRHHFDDEKLEELVASIRKKGILQPIVVRRTAGDGTPAEAPAPYMIVAGERRLRAARKAGLKEVPVIVKDVASSEAFELALIENVQREDLNPIEEALAYQRLIELQDYTPNEVADRVGKNRSTIANALRLLKLDGHHQSLVVEGRLSAGHARTLLSLEDPADRNALAEDILARGLSVREAEDWVRRHKEPQPEAGTPDQDEPGEKPEPRRAAHPLQPFYDAIAADLRAALGTDVGIQARGRKGKIQISFESLEDLDRLRRQLQLLTGTADAA
jgi:ParB family transcriptional regulator, chromosome partitioning protein